MQIWSDFNLQWLFLSFSCNCVCVIKAFKKISTDRRIVKNVNNLHGSEQYCLILYKKKSVKMSERNESKNSLEVKVLWKLL